MATDFGTDVDLAEKVEASLKLKEAQSTVSVRAALAQEIVKASSEQTRICETLIHDQHLQHQVLAHFSRPNIHFGSWRIVCKSHNWQPVPTLSTKLQLNAALG